MRRRAAGRLHRDQRAGASGQRAANRPIRRVARTPLAALCDREQARQSAAGLSFSTAHNTPLPGVDARLQAIGLDVQRVSYAQTIAPQILERNLRTLKPTFGRYRSAGRRSCCSKCRSTRVSRTRRARARSGPRFARSFQTLGFVSADELARGAPIRTVDGVHLARDESSRVAASLASHHADACAVARDGFARDPTRDG